MSEKTKTDDKKEEPADKPEDTGERLKSEADKEIDKINADTERINKAVAENENAKARLKLGGVTEAGQTPKVETEDEKWTKGAKERYEGTGMDPTPDDTPTTYK